MRTIVIGLGVMLSTTALAGESGNFRRAEVIKAAGVDNGYVSAVKSTKTDRVSVVETRHKAILVKAPLDRSKAAKKMTAKEANAMGLQTQAQARELARKNGGILGSKSKIKVEDNGVSASRWSYKFRQVSPASVIIPAYNNGKYRAHDIDRTVTIGNKGGAVESASSAYDYIPAATPSK
jgi:hypothetical protein